MAKVGLKDTLALIAKGYSKKEIDALAAIDEEDNGQEVPTPEEIKPKVLTSAEDNKKAQDDAAAEESNPEPDYKSMYEELQTKNKELEETVTKLQQSNVNKDSSKDMDEHKKEQSESLTNLVRSFM